ncbi:hypothetical protein DD237_000138 [Peronospora effusa]|uniref:Uncharacterized protein n=1 Tax=Peronospora effusa TaxID=542832 RepID=A0A425CMB4_9STRA|nr:hypothetical protein DD237_000138 [Peronospora effusa]
MSLGFLTESALVPSKAKEIKVDAKSLVDLKAVVFQKDQERKRRLQDALISENNDDVSNGLKAFRMGKYAHLRSGSKRHKRSEEDQVGKKHYNRGVEVRSRRDEEAKAREAPDEDDDAAWNKISTEMLRKKAKLYDELSSGIGRDHVSGECLVDFEAKREMGSSGVVTMMEILDEFGRTRSVPMDSEEYATFLADQQGLYRGKNGDEKGSDERGNRGEEVKVDGGSFVVSQWEKRLKSTEKTHLKEVHERATLVQSLADSSLAGTAGRKTRKQLRLERLRKQQEEVATSTESTALANATVDSAASEKATDFLQQLSSLM